VRVHALGHHLFFSKSVIPTGGGDLMIWDNSKTLSPMVPFGFQQGAMIVLTVKKVLLLLFLSLSEVGEHLLQFKAFWRIGRSV
jgi:hypothetical protein